MPKQIGRKDKIWTDEEVQFLIDNVDSMKNKELAEALGVSLDSVKMKIRSAKIVRKHYKEPVIDLEGEIWKQISVAPDYEVSNYGRVKKTSENFIKRDTKIKSTGYHGINLYINGKQHPFRLNRIVAITFIPNPENKPEVNHKDGNKDNNRADNLEWVTSTENKIHAVKNGLMTPPKLKGQNASNASLTDEQVHEICKLISEGKRNLEIYEIMNIEKRNIVSQIRRRKTWTHISKNYKW